MSTMKEVAERMSRNMETTITEAQASERLNRRRMTVEEWLAEDDATTLRYSDPAPKPGQVAWEDLDEAQKEQYGGAGMSFPRDLP